MDMSKRYSERFKMQVAYDYFGGFAAQIITQEYNICTRRLFRMVDTRCNSYLMEPPKFTEEELAKPKAFTLYRSLTREILKMDMQRRPVYGIRDEITGMWLQRLDKKGNMHPLLYLTVDNANAKLRTIKMIRNQHNAGNVDLRVQWYGWER